MNQETLHLAAISLASLILAIVVVALSRRRKISFRYTLGWLLLSGIGVVFGFLLPAVKPIAESLKVSEIALFAGAAVVVLLAVCIQLSVSISGLQRQLQDAVQEIALLRIRHETENRS